MIVWGGYAAGHRDTQPPRGAAYDPATDSWRTIAPSPIRWGLPSAGVWTGSEWVIAVQHLDGRVRIAAYDPETDQWRRLTDPPPGFAGVEVVWTEDELILSDGQSMLRMDPSGEAWRPGSVLPDQSLIRGPLFWTGGTLIARLAHDWHSPTFLAAWDPARDHWTELEAAPHEPPGDPLWMSGRIGFINGDLVYDVATDSWWDAPGMVVDDAGYEREGHVAVWADRHAIVWGGWLSPIAPIEPYETGSVLTPDW